jgi:hypothetical protein
MKTVTVLEEPELEFAGAQRLHHPRDGLTLFGPYDSKGIDRPRHITYGVFGTPAGIAKCKRLIQALQRPINTPEDLDERLWSHFPGFEEAFHAGMSIEPAWEGVVDPTALEQAATLPDEHARVFAVTNLYLSAITVAKKRDESFQIFICAVPDIVYQNCRPLSQVGDRRGRLGARQKKSRAVMLDMFDSYDPFQYTYSLDFRRQLKARVMEHDVPIQIVLESTLAVDDAPDDVTTLSDRAWNLSTAFYYKSGGRPWRLSKARPGVCYVGIAFKDTEDRGRNACSAAQLFLDDGDGVVFMGDEGQWFSPHRGDYHLTKASARRLLEGVLKSYKDLHGKPLTEIFLHCRSSINDDEFSGYTEACPPGAKLIAVRVAPERVGMRLYRFGTRPMLRGSFWQINDSRGFLWGSGFKPRLATYDGSEVPLPLCIEIQHGTADIRQVAKDILGLSKLNYNCCKLGENKPVTVHFSGAVGEILVTNKHLKLIKPNFKFYI